MPKYRQHFAVVSAVALLGSMTVAANAAIIAVDNVENSADYTATGMPALATTTTNPEIGFTALAGTRYVRTSTSSTGAINSAARFTAGFGALIRHGKPRPLRSLVT